MSSVCNRVSKDARTPSVAMRVESRGTAPSACVNPFSCSPRRWSRPEASPKDALEGECWTPAVRAEREATSGGPSREPPCAHSKVSERGLPVDGHLFTGQGSSEAYRVAPVVHRRNGARARRSGRGRLAGRRPSRRGSAAQDLAAIPSRQDQVTKQRRLFLRRPLSRPWVTCSRSRSRILWGLTCRPPKSGRADWDSAPSPSTRPVVDACRSSTRTVMW